MFLYVCLINSMLYRVHATHSNICLSSFMGVNLLYSLKCSATFLKGCNKYLFCDVVDSIQLLNFFYKFAARK